MRVMSVRGVTTSTASSTSNPEAARPSGLSAYPDGAPATAPAVDAEDGVGRHARRPDAAEAATGPAELKNRDSADAPVVDSPAAVADAAHDSAAVTDDHAAGPAAVTDDPGAVAADPAPATDDPTAVADGAHDSAAVADGAGPAAIQEPDSTGTSPAVAARTATDTPPAETAGTPVAATGRPATDAADSTGTPPGGPRVAGPDGPPAPPRRGRDPLWAKVLIALGALLMVLSTGAVAATELLAHRYESTVRKGTLIAPEARTGAIAGDVRRPPHGTVTGPLNYLLIGSDARSDSPDAGERSDTIIIVHFPVTMERAYLISVPRDLRVQIPPFAPTGFRGAHEKINGAFEYGKGGDGGVQLLSATLSKLMGITFDGAAVIDFGGFQKVVQQLGGVDLCVDERTESHHVGFDRNGKFLAPWYGPEGAYRNYASTPVVYEPGCQHMQPWQALDYSRQRKSIPDGDYGRQRHQQQLLKAIFAEARKQGVATNPVKLDGLIRAVGSSLTVDTNKVPLADLMYALRDVKPANLVGIKLPSEAQYVGGISYVMALDDQAPKLYQAIQDDTLDSWVDANPTWINPL